MSVSLANGITLRVGSPGSPSPAQRHHEPVTCGIPWPRGSLAEGSLLELHDADGMLVPLQTRVLDRWPDGSVRWLLLDWQASVPVEGDARYRLVRPATHTSAQGPATGALKAVECAGGVEIDSGAVRFRLTPDALFSDVEVGGVRAIDAARSGLRAEGERGEVYRPHVERLWLDESGPLRAKVCAEGELRDERGGHFLALFLELDFFAGSGAVRLLCTLRNRRAAGHPGGYWSLGSAGSVYLRDFALTLAVPGAGASGVSVSCSPERGMPSREFAQPFELYQDSSGGENWRSSNHVNRHGQVPITFRGYRVRHPGEESTGLRANPVVVLRGGPVQVGVTVPAFWENFPVAVEAAEGALTLRLFPRQFADVHEIQGGEQKTHLTYLCFGPDRVTDVPLNWCRSPSVARAEPQWYAASGAVPYLAARDEDTDPGYARLVQSALEGENTFEHKREVIDQYGWRHFGEIYGDHEAVLHKGPTPLVSHYNNQYDAIAGFAFQFLRTGDVRWVKHLSELARHVIDVDVYHTDQDKSAYNGGLFWHTVHYVDAGTATHRTYPKAPGVPGGGPGNEQNYTTGLMLHHFLTGDRASRQAAIGLARWVIDMDDGRKTPFRWLAGGATGLASSSRTPSYHGPGRGSANSLAALLDGHRLTGDAAFLEKAEELIRRVIHPSDDVPARNLLDAENRWFYVMFLQSLGKYLQYKAERGDREGSYAYAQASLLHYATWMAEHEYPYLHKPELLEYPTETWAAQDMRKSEVFWYAWLHAPDEQRERFRERARYFFDYSVQALEGMPTRHLCRPVVLLASHGLRHGWFERNPDARAPEPIDPPTDFGRPAAFEPQKPRALRRFARLAACGLALGVAACLLLVWWAWGRW